MKTEALVELLARGAGPAPRAVTARRLGPAAACGLAASALLALGLYGPLPAPMYGSLVPWMKLAYAAALALAAAWLTACLARPVARPGAPSCTVAGVIAVMGASGALALLRAEPGTRGAELLGVSWSSCPWSVLVLSLPALAATLWAVRGLAPARPAAAGFASGVFAGALGALGYSLSCPEASAAFVALWYTAGIGLAGTVGAVLGTRVLRW